MSGSSGRSTFQTAHSKSSVTCLTAGDGSSSSSLRHTARVNRSINLKNVYFVTELNVYVISRSS